MDTEDRSRRVAVTSLSPEIEGGRFPVKRAVGDTVVVEADVFGDGHDRVAADLLWRQDGDEDWSRTALAHLGNDRHRASFPVTRPGFTRFLVEAWIDRFGTWSADLVKRVEAGQDVATDLRIGAEIVARALPRAEGADRKVLEEAAAVLADEALPSAERVAMARDDELAALLRAHPDLSRATRSRELEIRVDRPLAAFSAWYEMFPRSASPEPGRHGTFRDVIERLPYVERMGFDILYLPPIHPIGRTFRKGKNNRETCEPDDVGSPWAIGGQEGGHTAIHPELGTISDFHDLVAAAAERGLEIALDLAYQCSPDHPWVKEHPDWFRKRPDGTIQYAENPPKKYQDIYPIDFESADRDALWEALREVVLFWIGHGVSVFRVDNPHTKAFEFWEWMIRTVQEEHQDVIFLAEAFTRPKVMYRLAKLGFTHSYTYFTWRDTRAEFVEYLTELTRTEAHEFFRPNFWPNTPDILPEHLQTGGRAAFVARLVMAATLSPNYGIYGPAFELLQHIPLKPGSEEYLDSEKYEVKLWNLDAAESLAEFIGLLNAARRENPALHSNRNLVFHAVDNERLLVYSQSTDDRSNSVIVAVNLDFHHAHGGWLELDLGALGIGADEPFQVLDVFTDVRYVWRGARNYVQLDPGHLPVHLFVVRREVRREHDFDYYG